MRKKSAHCTHNPLRRSTLLTTTTTFGGKNIWLRFSFENFLAEIGSDATTFGRTTRE
jgi:hypothetical protein